MGSVHRNGGFGGYGELIMRGYGSKGDIITVGDVLESGELL